MKGIFDYKKKSFFYNQICPKPLKRVFYIRQQIFFEYTALILKSGINGAVEIPTAVVSTRTNQN